MKIGTYYYPDQWPREQWTRDFDNIAKMGLQIVHLAEFAWGTIEPRDGEYHFDWIDECLRLAGERNLDVILCTPSAVVPAWMVDKYPDVLHTGNRFGGRRHANQLHPAYIEKSVAVAREMATRFGSHPRVIGFQIDNELGGGSGDQSPITHTAFRDWLRAKYGEIDTLNRRWGCAFWNTYYSSFDQIKYPGSKDPSYRNPHQNVDGQRFWAWSYKEFSRRQAEAMRPHVGERFITTNFMPFFTDIDPAECADHLSLWSWDTYPISGIAPDAKDEKFRLADPDGPGFLHDQMASFNGRWALMEVQPGQINWSGYPVRTYPGAIRLLLWHAIAHACEFITVYRFRQPRFGVEMWHDGLVQWDGETPSPGGLQFSQVVAEVKQLAAAGIGSADSYQPLMRDPKCEVVGIVYEQDQLYNYATLPQAKRWNQSKLVTQYHSAIHRLGLHAKVVSPEADWSGLPVLIVPGLQMASDATVSKLRAYVEAGGHLIMTARSCTLDKDGQAPLGLYGHRLFELIGATIEGYDSLPEETFGMVEIDGRKHRWGIWAELLKPTTAEPIGTYVDQFYAGTAAVLQHNLGEGTVTYVGAIDQGSLADTVVERVCKQLRFDVAVLPKRTRMYSMQGCRVFLNFNDNAVTAPAAADAEFLIGQRRVEAGGVAVWRV
jgi:beta-galactosidase